MQPRHDEPSVVEEHARRRPAARRAAQSGAPTGEQQPPGSLPPLTVGEALVRHWKLIALITLVGAAAGLALGLARTPSYTSESELNVGSLDAQAQAIPGYAQAAQTLAEAYARVVGTTRIEARAAKVTHTSLGYVAAHLTAASIPNNPVFRIDGTGPSAAAAQTLTAAATRGVIGYARAQTTPLGASAALDAYKQETVLAGQLSSKVGRLKARYDPNPSPGQQAQITRVQQDAAGAQLQANAEQQLYVYAITTKTSAGAVILLSPAGPATSNRQQSAEIGGFAGLIVGCLIGCALAIWVAARRRRQLMQALVADFETVG